MPPKRYVSQAEFSRIFGITEASVTQSIERGRINRRKREGRWVIDLKTEASKFAATARSLTSRNPPTILTGSNPPADNGGANKGSLSEVVQSRESREKYRALKEQMEYERDAGLLVPMKDVEDKWASIAITIRKAVLALPDRLAPLMAAEDDARACWQLLDRESRMMLEDLAEQLKQGGS